MFKKSFVEVLKENLSQDSFKQPNPPSIAPKLLPSQPSKEYTNCDLRGIKDPFLQEIKRFFVSMTDINEIYGSRDFYKNLFKKPIKRIFYWCEEDYQGSILVIYYYKNKYIYTKGSFGSCELCDGFPDTEDALLEEFSDIEVCDKIEDINIHGYNPEFTHPDLVKKFEKFKKKNDKLI